MGADKEDALQTQPGHDLVVWFSNLKTNKIVTKYIYWSGNHNETAEIQRTRIEIQLTSAKLIISKTRTPVNRHH